MIEFTSKKPKVTFGETVEVTFTAPRAKLEALTLQTSTLTLQ